jgi:hypothetical protein
MARVRLPAGLTLPEGVYDHADVRLAPDWDVLREVEGVEVECKRHLDQWWPTAGMGIELGDLQTWYCPRCAWAFRQSLGGRGGTPQF